MSKKPKAKRGRPEKALRDKISDTVTIRLPYGGRGGVNAAARKMQERESEFMRTAVMTRVAEVLSADFPGSQKES